MAHVLNLVYGSTVIGLASGDYRLMKYTPQTAREGAESVVETAVIEITGATIAALQADIHAIETAFVAAKKRGAGRSWSRLFVVFQPDGYTEEYQSEIVSGELMLPESTLQADWANKRLEVTLIWTRRAVWEAVDWTAVPLTNTNGTDDTAGLRVYNCADGVGSSPNDRVNYVAIDGDSVVGDLPGPVKLSLTPEVVSIHRVFMGVYVDEDGLGIPAMAFDSTSFAFLTGGALTTVANAGCSGGSYINVTTDALGVAEVYANISMAAFKGAWLRPIMRVFDSHILKRLTIQFKIGNILISEASGAIINDTRLVQPLGLIRIPPYPFLANTPTGQLVLRMESFSDDGWGTHLYFAFDTLLFLGTDFYAEIGRDDTESVGVSQRMIESWDLDAVSYVESLPGGTNQYRYANIKTGSGIFLTPGKDQRINFAMRNGSGDYVTSAMLVQCWYKPRRLTL